MTLETYHILFRSSHFLKEFSQSPQSLTAPDFRLQPPRLLFLVDEYPKTNRGQPPQCPRIRRPTLRRRQARLPCQLPQDRPLCQILGHRFRTPSGSQSQFPTTPIRSTNNWVRSFILPYPGTRWRRALAPGARRPEPQVLEPIGGLYRGSLGNLKSSPSPLFRSVGGVYPSREPRRRETLLTLKRLPQNGYATAEGPQ